MNLIPALVSFLVVTPQISGLRASQVFFAPEAKLLSVVGRKDPSTVREFGMTLLHPGFTKVWVNGAGPKMTQVKFCLAGNRDWRAYLGQLGLNGRHARATALSVPESPVPLYRNKFRLSGVTGLPQGGWSVYSVEYAVPNRGRLRQMRNQIRTTAPGPQRNQLIRSCYDWYSELDFVRG